MDPRLVGYVAQLHAVVDELAASVAAKHGPRLRCGRGCSGCCVDGLTVFEVEAALIAERHADVLVGEAAPEGRCAMLDADGGCRIYADRPYVCRTQGLPLRWIEEEAGEIVEGRDICPLNADGEPIEELPADACWAIGPFEQRLAAAQAKCDGGALRRVALRDLFGSAKPA